MNEEIFRKKSLDKVKSPESLEDYIRVANPGVWLLLASIIILLAGACVWGIFGHVDSAIPTSVRSSGGVVVCFVGDEDISSVKAGLNVEFEDYTAVVAEIGQEGGKYICALKPDQTVPDGFYDGKIIKERYKPLSFIVN